MLVATDYREMNAWQLAVKVGKVEMLLKQWELVKGKLTRQEINEILLAKNKDGKTLWHMIGQKEDPGQLQKVWQWAKNVLTTEEIKIMLLFHSDSIYRNISFWDRAVVCCGRGLLLDIWEWIKEKLTFEVYKLLTDTDNRAGKTWFEVSEQEILQKLWDLIEDYLTREEIKHKFLIAFFQKTIMCGTLDLLQKIWEWAKEKLTPGEMNNKLLLAKIKGRTVLHVAAEVYELEILQEY
jgi:hypothetical protein